MYYNSCIDSKVGSYCCFSFFYLFRNSSSNIYKHTGLYFATTLFVCSRICSITLYTTGVNQRAAGDELTLAVLLVEVLLNACEKTHSSNTENRTVGLK